jgi:hypothetical protein
MPIEKRGNTAPHKFTILVNAKLCEVNEKTKESHPMPLSDAEAAEYGVQSKRLVELCGFDRRETILKLKRWLESAST